MCTTKKLLFSTRSYRLRKWLELQYNSTMYKSASSNSYYYFIKSPYGTEFKIRISDHFPTEKKLSCDYSVVISFDPHDINKNVYIITLKGFENNIISINDFRELKYDINHAVIYSKFLNDMRAAINSHAENAVQTAVVAESRPKKKPLTPESVEALKHANAKNRTTNNRIWSPLCTTIPGWLTFDKTIHKAIRELFSTNIDFNDGCQFIEENRTLSKAKFVVALYKKLNDVNKEAANNK